MTDNVGDILFHVFAHFNAFFAWFAFPW